MIDGKPQQLELGGAGLSDLIRRHFRDHRRRIALLLLLALVLAGVSVVPPAIVARLVDLAVAGTASVTTAMLAIATLAALALFDALLTFARRRLTTVTELAVRDDLATQHFLRTTRLPLTSYGGGNEAALIRSFDDLDGLTEFVTSHAIDLLTQSLIIAAYVILMLFFDWRLTSIFLGLAVLGLVHSIYLARAVQRSVDVWLPIRDSRFGFIVECITSMLTIKATGAHANIGAPFQQEQQAEQQAMKSLRNARSLADAASRFWSIATPGIGTAFGVALLAKGEVSPGTLVLFLSVSGGLVAALSAAHQLVQELHQARANLRRLQEVTATLPEGLDDPIPADSNAIEGIEATGLTYLHAGAVSPAVQDVSLTLRRGEHVAVVGRSGEGKTTLAHLLTRFLPPVGGSIELQNFAQTSLAEHRRRVVVVPHVIAVFSATVRDNVRLWDASVTDDRIFEALRLAGLNGFVESQEAGLDAVIGPRGNPLSAGQRQRIGLARAFLDSPEVLILDESTSALDFATEEDVLQNIRSLMQGRILIVITHRDHVARTFDRILLMQDGRLIDS